MIRITAQIENRLADMAGRQLPFVASLALNRTATGARDVVKGNLPSRFTLRNRWTVGGIQARTSTKTNLVAQVMAPGYMQIQETGGTRTPLESKLLAAPTDAIKGKRVIPKAKRPRALIESGKGFILPLKDGSAGVFKRYGKKRGQIRLLYALTPDQSYDERFMFEADVEGYVKAQYSVHFADALFAALR